MKKIIDGYIVVRPFISVVVAFLIRQITENMQYDEKMNKKNSQWFSIWKKMRPAMK
jgi:hypothetical protein